MEVLDHQFWKKNIADILDAFVSYNGKLTDDIKSLYDSNCYFTFLDSKANNLNTIFDTLKSKIGSGATISILTHSFVVAPENSAMINARIMINDKPHALTLCIKGTENGFKIINQIIYLE